MGPTTADAVTEADRLVRLYFEKFFSAPGDMALADRILSDDVVFASPVTPVPLRGVQAFKRFTENWSIAFPDRRFTVEETVYQPGRGAARFTMTGTHTGPFDKVAPTGRRLQVSGVDLFEFTSDRISRISVFFFVNPVEVWASKERA